MSAGAVATEDAKAEAKAAPVEEIVDVGGGMELCFVAEGDPAGVPLLLLAGLGQQLNVWPAEMRDGLVERGFRVIRCDNRDVGRSGRASCPPPTARSSSPAASRPRSTTSGRCSPTRSASSMRSGSNAPTWSACRWAG